MIKSWFLILWLLSLGSFPVAQAQKIVQRDLNPPQIAGSHSGIITKIEYTQHKMIVHFMSENNEHATLYGPGHKNSWRLYDTLRKKEYAMLYIKNIRVNGELVVPLLDKPEGEEFVHARQLSCEIHFERPGKDTRVIDMIEEGIRQYKRQTPYGFNAQWPYNIYNIRVLAYTDDMRNSKPPVQKPPVKLKPKPTTPPVQKPVPKPAPKDSVVAEVPPKENPKPKPAEKVEDFGSKVEAGRTYRLHALLFKQSAYEMEPESYPQLDSLVSIMTKNPTMEIELAGHTDNVGDAKLNVALSQKRVDAVKSYLTNKGIAPSRIQTQAYGGSKPIADNSREETKRLNRRVEVKILRE